MISEGLMYFFGVQAPVTDQFAVEQQYRNLVAVARLRGGGSRIDIEHVDSDCRGFRHAPRGRSASPRTDRSQDVSTAGSAAPPRPGVCLEISGEEARRRLMILTEWAMNSTVCAGTSPTAVTWWPCTTVEKAYPEPTRTRPCMGGSAGTASVAASAPGAASRCASTNTDTVASPSEYTR